MSESNKIDFEKSIKKLEEIVSKLESSKVPLQESLLLFEEGTSIVRECASYLDGAEQKITELMKSKEDNKK